MLFSFFGQSGLEAISKPTDVRLRHAVFRTWGAILRPLVVGPSKYNQAQGLQQISQMHQKSGFGCNLTTLSILPLSSLCGFRSNERSDSGLPELSGGGGTYGE
jgi:hypothetical protein